VSFLVDTNILTYAVNRDCDENPAAAAAIGAWLSGAIP
jgi:predicted nucleic acid-binding protein